MIGEGDHDADMMYGMRCWIQRCYTGSVVSSWFFNGSSLESDLQTVQLVLTFLYPLRLDQHQQGPTFNTRLNPDSASNSSFKL